MAPMIFGLFARLREWTSPGAAINDQPRAYTRARLPAKFSSLIPGCGLARLSPRYPQA
jgi:hypothetical protein